MAAMLSRPQWVKQAIPSSHQLLSRTCLPVWMTVLDQAEQVLANDRRPYMCQSSVLANDKQLCYKSCQWHCARLSVLHMSTVQCKTCISNASAMEIWLSCTVELSQHKTEIARCHIDEFIVKKNNNSTGHVMMPQRQAITRTMKWVLYHLVKSLWLNWRQVPDF